LHSSHGPQLDGGVLVGREVVRDAASAVRVHVQLNGMEKPGEQSQGDEEKQE